MPYEPPPTVKVTAAEMLAALEADEGGTASRPRRRKRVVFARRGPVTLQQIDIWERTSPHFSSL